MKNSKSKKTPAVKKPAASKKTPAKAKMKHSGSKPMPGMK